MFSIRGKYNKAIIMAEGLDETTMRQLYSILNHPAFGNSHIAIMSDAHAGSGAVIGFTQTINGYVVPHVVGVDIGCGVEAFNLGQVTIDFESLDEFVRENIPSGFHVRGEPVPIPKQLEENIERICAKIDKADEVRAWASVGTLGGGNHFIEVDQAPDDTAWLVIHSGSRKFGLDIANYHQNKAKDLMKQMFIGDAYKKLEFLPMDNGGQEYLEDMEVAQKYAELNRRTMARLLVEDYFGLDMTETERIKSVHNYIDLQDKIIRKGAIAAHKDEKVVIPLNMRDGTIVGTGLGSEKWNYSAPHGAGRVMSRRRAKEDCSLKEFQEVMGDVWSSCICEKTLDESPMAYKNMELITSTVEETVEIDFIMKPIYNFKAT